jgi:hypothetical protein
MSNAWTVAVWLALAAIDPAIADEVSRLDGQRVTVADDGASYTIDDIAGEGTPVVGRVERRGELLVIMTDSGRSHELVGPLAVPRIAGPGYKVWVIGDIDADGRLAARRLGVLAPP